MANTVNGVTASATDGVLTDATRQRAGIYTGCRFVRPYHTGVLRARLVIDTAGDVCVDDPTVVAATESTRPNSRIYPLAYSIVEGDAALQVNTRSKVGSGTAVELEELEFAANGGLYSRICEDEVHPPTDAGGKLILGFSAACIMLVHYVIADQLNW